ncbi:MAG: ABC transporter permease [Propionibacteriaceae bacterium]|jgi:oligopeptide transport system permease protein|nr:ABC transporter permease [Propionibacteriaceae bacterium]
MARYVLARAGQAVVVMLAATLLLYAMVYAMPGDPVAALVGSNSATQLDEATIARIRQQYNLDKPFIVQYLLYLQGVFQGDLGTTFAGRPVTEIIGRAFPVTFRLAVITVAIQSVIGVAVGLIAGRRRGGVFDGAVMLVTMLLIGVPTFVSGYIVQYFLGVRWGIVKPTVSAQAGWAELIVPAAVLALGSLAFLIRFTRSGVSEAMRADHVTAARARGLPEWQITLSHVLRNALIPIVTVVGTEFGALLGGAIITEAIFNIPGYGQQVYQNIIRGESAPTVSLVIVLVVVFVVVNLVVDLLYAVLNPKVRYGAA